MAYIMFCKVVNLPRSFRHISHQYLVFYFFPQDVFLFSFCYGKTYTEKYTKKSDEMCVCTYVVYLFIHICVTTTQIETYTHLAPGGSLMTISDQYPFPNDNHDSDFWASK